MSKVGMSVDTADGKIIVIFDRSVEYLEFNPTQAGEFARAIVDAAMRLDKKGATIIMPEGMKQ